MSRRAGRRGKHRVKPRRYSSARVHGTLGGWSAALAWRRRGPQIKEWCA